MASTFAVAVILSGFGVADEGIHHGQDAFAFGGIEIIDGGPAVEHGLIGEGLGDAGIVVQVIHGDAKCLGEFGDNIGRRHHFAAFIASDHGRADAGFPGQIRLGPAVVPAELVNLAGEGWQRFKIGRHVIALSPWKRRRWLRSWPRVMTHTGSAMQVWG